ncbi:MAG: hypothetical protein GX649_19385 [Chloroflexi bacterium]|nr:hypothetical protein [Chloroflexota bacterium]
MTTEQERPPEAQSSMSSPMPEDGNGKPAPPSERRGTPPEDPPLEAALAFLVRGWAPIPLCWPTSEGACGSGRGHQGNNIGKALLLGAGYQTLQPTEADVRR